MPKHYPFIPGSMATSARYQPQLPLSQQEEETPMDIVQGFPVPPSVIPRIPLMPLTPRPTFKQRAISTAQQAYEHLQEVGNVIKQQRAIEEAGGIGNIARNSLLAYAIGRASGGNTAPLEGFMTAHSAAMQARQKRELEEEAESKKFEQSKELEHIKGGYGVTKVEEQGTTAKEVAVIKTKGATEGATIRSRATVKAAEIRASATKGKGVTEQPVKPIKPTQGDYNVVKDFERYTQKRKADPLDPDAIAYWENFDNSPTAQQQYLEAKYRITGKRYELNVFGKKVRMGKAAGQQAKPNSQPAKKIEEVKYNGNLYRGSYNASGGFDATHKWDAETQRWVKV